MSTVIKIKRSTSSGSAPATGSLAAGELAVNITDKKMWVGTGGELDAPVLLVDYTAMIGGGGISDGDKGDITVSSSGTVWTIDNNVVSVAKISATGTPNSNTFLRGDGQWATPTGASSIYDNGTGLLLDTNNIFSIDPTVVATVSYVNSAISAIDTTPYTGGSAITIDTNNAINLNFAELLPAATTIDKYDYVPFLDMTSGGSPIGSKLISAQKFLAVSLANNLSLAAYDGNPANDQRTTIAVQDQNPNAFSIQTLQNGSGSKTNILKIDTDVVGGANTSIAGTNVTIEPTDSITLGLASLTINSNGNISLTNADSITFSADAGSIIGINQLTAGSTGEVQVNGDLFVTGDIVVGGTNTVLNTTTVTVEDKNIELGVTASPSDTTADGGGITLKGTTDKTILWDNANDNWTFSEHVNVASGKVYKINNTEVLNATTLGSGITGSSLTSVGTLTSGTLGSGFTTVATSVGGTGLTSFTVNGAVYATDASTLTTGTLPVASGGTGITSFGTGVATWLGTPSSANLRSALTDETGSGSVVFNTSPAFTTSVTTGSTTFSVFNTTATTVTAFGAATSLTLGATTGSSIIRNPTLTLGNTTSTINTNSGTTNSISISPYGNFIVAPGSSTPSLGGSSTVLTVTNGMDATGLVTIVGGDLYLGTKSPDELTYQPVNIIFEGGTDDIYETTLTVTDPTADRTIALPNASGTVALTANKLSDFASTTSAELAGIISDETGSGSLVFANTPTLVTPVLGVATGTSLSLTSTSNVLDIVASTDGAGLRIAQATSGAGSRVGAIRLGRSATATFNTFIQNSSGTLSFYNGIDSTGTLLFSSSTSGTNFSAPLNVSNSTELRLLDGNLTPNYVGLKSVSSLSNSNIYTLPSAVGTANQVLSIATVTGNDATLQWSTPSGGGTNTTTQTIDFSELINQIQIVIYGLGADFATSLRNIENYTIDSIVFDTGSAGGYSCVLESIESFYDATNGWSARLIVKPTFAGGSSTTAEGIITEIINTVYINATTSGGATIQDFWQDIQSQTLLHKEETYRVKTVTGLSWVSSSSFITCKIMGSTTTDHDAEDAILEGVTFEINNIVNGVGFDIIGHAPNGTYGKYTIKCLGQ